MMQSSASFPAAFNAADSASLEGQSNVVHRVSAALVLVIVAAAAGIVSWRVGPSDVDVFAAVALAAFVTSGLLTALKSYGDAETRWYKGRAVAESAKTLAWRYAVGGDPFPVREPEQQANALLADRIRDLLDQARDVELGAYAGDQITDDMRTARRLPFDERKALYLRGRIDDQIRWYTTKATTNRSQRKTWSRITAGANAAGAAGALIRFLGVDVDLLGLAAAAAGAATAWTQVRQHRNLAISYSVAAQDLALARTRLEQKTDEDTWALEVSDAEEAISREHTMWLARHGHPRVDRT